MTTDPAFEVEVVLPVEDAEAIARAADANGESVETYLHRAGLMRARMLTDPDFEADTLGVTEK